MRGEEQARYRQIEDERGVHDDAGVRADGVGLARPEEIVGQPFMRDEDALGTARGAWRIGAIGGLRGVGRRDRRQYVRRIRLAEKAVERDDRDAVREGGSEAGEGEHGLARSFGEDEGDAVGRVGGVERQVGAACLQDAKETRDHLRAPVEIEADDRVGREPSGAQPVREAAGCDGERGGQGADVKVDFRSGIVIRAEDKIDGKRIDCAADEDEKARRCRIRLRL
jgi:hypothetical protein